MSLHYYNYQTKKDNLDVKIVPVEEITNAYQILEATFKIRAYMTGYY